MSYRLALTALTIVSVITGIVVGFLVDNDFLSYGMIPVIQITFGIASTVLFLVATSHTMWLAARSVWRRFRRRQTSSTSIDAPRWPWFRQNNERRPIGFL